MDALPQPIPFAKRFLLSSVSLLIATAIWMPMLHFVFRPRTDGFRAAAGLSQMTRELAQRHMDVWATSADGHLDIDRMRVNNPEWDFMGRTYLVLSLANMALHDPQHEAEYLALTDKIIAETRAMVQSKGITYFLMDYARTSSFRQQPVRSAFVDGELALMLGARRLVRETDALGEPMRALVELTATRMSSSPVLSCESYPDECWTFCNTVALAAIRIGDVLDGTDHGPLLQGWVHMARGKLIDANTGLLCSSYSYDGHVGDGPEGSSIWMAAHCLQLVDEAFAADQYARARAELRHASLQFGWAGEWPRSWQGPMDIDSGPVIPVLDVSAGSSGLAFVGAAAFEDRAYYGELATTLNFAGFPMSRRGRLQYCAGNQVGDAVLLYSTVLGPLWNRVKERAAAGGGV